MVLHIYVSKIVIFQKIVAYVCAQYVNRDINWHSMPAIDIYTLSGGCPAPLHETNDGHDNNSEHHGDAEHQQHTGVHVHVTVRRHHLEVDGGGQD